MVFFTLDQHCAEHDSDTSSGLIIVNKKLDYPKFFRIVYKDN